MPEKENKVQFSFKNVYYALLTDGEKATWGTPVAIPGGVELKLEFEGEINKFYADGVVFYQSPSDSGYSGSATFARIPEQMLKDVWGFEEDETDFVLTEKAGVEPKQFALLFQIDGDQNNQLYCWYNCSATKPAINAETTTDTKEPTTQELSIAVAPLADGRIKASTTAKTPTNIRENWFKKVYEKAGV